jgi:amino acid permease
MNNIMSVLILIACCLVVAYVISFFMEKLHQNAIKKLINNMGISTLSDVVSGGEYEDNNDNNI